MVNLLVNGSVLSSLKWADTLPRISRNGLEKSLKVGFRREPDDYIVQISAQLNTAFYIFTTYACC